MPTLSSAGRTLLLAATLAAPAAAPAAAQTFRLVDPALSVDGRRVGVVGAPLVQEPFGALVLSVPGSGTYRVAAAPFDGARPVGQFDGDGLFFAVDGRSVRLRSAEALLPGLAPTTAFVRFDSTDARDARGLARVSVADAPGTPDGLAARTEAPRRGPDLSTLDARADAERLRLELDRVTAQRRALEAERDRLRAERDRLGPRWTGPARSAVPQSAVPQDALQDAVTRVAQLADERARLAANLDAARRRADAAPTRTDALDAQADIDRLRADVVAHDRAIAALQAENADLSLRLEADRSAAAPGLAGEPRRLLSERPSLLDPLTEAQASRDALQIQVEVLQNERDALRTRVDQLSSDLAAAQAAAPAPVARPPLAPRDSARGGTEGPRGAYFPGFDFGRLQNADAVRRRLDEAEYPAVATEGRIEGDVLVLFQTDRDGRVIRTAVASPIGGGLDGLAEALVREMRFVPPVVDGLPTGLRSQVLVRFEM